MARSSNLRARDITWRELRARIQEGSDIAALPVGSTEMHGPQMPLGTDTYIAEAVAMLAAEKMGATLFDTVSYSWPGMTKYTRGTISLTLDLEKQYVRAICNQLLRNGFRRIYLIQWHGPGHALTELVREFTEEQGAPIAFYSLMRIPSNGVEDFRRAGAEWEASLCLAAARMLGAEPQIDPETLIVPNRAPQAAAHGIIAASGAQIGNLAFTESDHAPAAGPLDLPLAEKTLHAMADAIAATADAMAQWRDAWKNLRPEESWREDDV